MKYPLPRRAFDKPNATRAVTQFSERVSLSLATSMAMQRLLSMQLHDRIGYDAEYHERLLPVIALESPKAAGGEHPLWVLKSADQNFPRFHLTGSSRLIVAIDLDGFDSIDNPILHSRLGDTPKSDAQSWSMP